MSLENYEVWSETNSLLYSFDTIDAIPAGGNATIVGNYFVLVTMLAATWKAPAGYQMAKARIPVPSFLSTGFDDELPARATYPATPSIDFPRASAIMPP